MKRDACASSRVRSNWCGCGIAAVIAFLLLFSPGNAHGQVTTADVIGTVTDVSNAVVPGATVTITNIGTSASQTAVTSGTGEYIFNLLQVGTYTLKVEAKGFKTFRAPSVSLSSADRVRVDAQLEVGDVTQTVEVQAASAPALQTDTSTISTLVTAQAVEDVPLNGRNLTKLIQLAPGVNQGVPNDLMSGARPDDVRPTAAYSANGQADSANNSMVDGMDNNEHTVGSSVIRPSIDGVQEVNVSTNLYDASVTRTAGAVVDVITKSGTNSFHGSVYEFFRNRALNANPNYAFPSSYNAATGALNLTTVLKKPQFQQNQYGASIGGPIRKDKTFFFADFEKLNQAFGVPLTATVPTLCNRGLGPCPDGLTPTDIGDFSDQNNISAYGGSPAGCTPNQFVPVSGPVVGTHTNCYYVIVPTAKITPLGRAYLNMYPLPTNAGVSNNYNSNPLHILNSYVWDVRGDHRFSANDTMFLRYSYNNVKSVVPGAFPAVTLTPAQDPLLTAPLKVFPTGINGFGSFPGVGVVTSQGLGASYVHVFSSNLLFNAKGGFDRFVNNTLPFNTGTNAANKLGFACNSANCINYGLPLASGLPSIFAGNYATLGDQIFIPIVIYQTNFQGSGVVTWNKGSQSIRIGASLIRRRLTHATQREPSGSYTFSGGYTGNGPGDLLEGLSSGGSFVGARVVSIVQPGLRSWEPGFFVQDDWRAKRWLTLNLGGRYDIFTPETEKYGRITNFNPANGLLEGPGIPGVQQSGPTAGVNTDYKNFSPRVGFAATLGHGMVLRGGFGMSYYAVIANTFKNPPYTASFNCSPQNSNGGNSVCPTSIANAATVEYGALPGGNSQVAPFPNPNGVGQGGLLFQAALPIPAIDVTSVTAPASCPVGAVANSAGCAAPTAPGGPGNPYAAFAGQVSAVWPNYPTPYLEQFNLQLQKEYKGNVVQIGYVGELGRHNGGNVNISGNPGTPNFGGISNNHESLALKTAGVGGTPLANPLAGQYPWLQHGVINPLMAWGTASYHALQVSFVRRFQRGLTVNVNYTWAHALAIGYGPCQPAYSPAQLGFGTGPKYIYPCFYDNVKSAATPIIENQWGHGPGQLGNTLFDLRNRVSGTINYQLPFGSSMTGIEGAFVKGWSVNLAGSWQSGAPFSPTNGAPFGGTNADGSSVVGGGLDQTCSGNYAQRSLQQWFNPACFSQPTINTFGTMDGSQLHGPSQRNVDFSIFKEFPVKERLRMQFRTEVFNLFNTPNFATPSAGIPAFSAAGVGLARRPSDLTGLNTGAITSKTVGAEPREIQFALKLLF